jgi:hypothetical protein
VNWTLAWYVAIGIAGAVAVRLMVYLVWWAIGKYRMQEAGPRPLHAATHRLWFDPGPVEAMDPVGGPGGAAGMPRPPFNFVEEHLAGSQPCVSIRDGAGRTWRVKWGDEVRSETFAVRFAWACGYFAEVTHFVRSGTIAGCPASLQRARACIGENDGRFCDARFELEDPAANKMFEEHSWSWDDNPFVGTKELSGLKIVVMLLSNWDTKDRRDVARGSNTAIYEYRKAGGHREARYLLSDWGGSLGRWGSMMTRGRWDCDGYAEQTPLFVSGSKDGFAVFGYAGQRTADIAQGIPLDHVRWFHPYAARLTSDYLTRALLASGADDEEARRFVAALTDRIQQLGTLVVEEAYAAAQPA